MMAPVPFAPSTTLTRKILYGSNDLRLGKELARTIIAGNRYLSIPVEGGSSRLKGKSADLSAVNISNHGRWRQEHLGAWNAAYGKTPFFPYIFPMMEDAYTYHSHGLLVEFNKSMFDIFLKFTDFENVKPSIEILKKTHPLRFEQLHREYETKVNLNYSIFDTLFRLGKNSVWIL